MSLNVVEVALAQQGMSRRDIIKKIEAIGDLPSKFRKSPEEAAQMLLEQHPGFNLLLEDKDEDIFK